MKSLPKTFFVYVVTLIVAACSIIYELLLANEISLAAGNTVVWYSLAIGGYLGFLGLGSLVYSRFSETDQQEKRLFWVEIFLCFFGALSGLLIKFSHVFSIFVLAQGFGAKSYLILFGTAFLLVAIIGFLSGIELPVLMDVAKKSSQKDVSNRILGADYFGSLLGAVFFSLVLVSNFSGIHIGFFTACLNFAVAIVLFFCYRLSFLKKFSFANFFLALTVAVLFLGVVFPQKIEQFLAKKYYYYPQAAESWKEFFGPMEELPAVLRKQTPYQTIDLVEQIEFSLADLLVNSYIDREKLATQPSDEFVEKTLYLNGDWQLSTTTERVYHEYFAHVPVQAAGMVPARVLILGGGDGMLLREILKYPDVREVVQVELDKEMVETAKSDESLALINENSFGDARVKIVFEDGFHYLQNNSEKFDAVYVDFPVPFDYNLSKLYSREIYYFASKAIDQTGYLAVYAPALAEFKGFDEEGWMSVDEAKTPWKEYYNTLKAAGFSTVLPFFTNLERDEINARRLLEEILQQEKKAKGNSLGIELDKQLVWEKTSQEIDARMENFVVSMQESFIFAQKKAFEGKFDYADRGVEYAVINKRRFFQAFQILLPGSKEIEWKYVNSIIKPTLPKSSLWRIRFPYYLD